MNTWRVIILTVVKISTSSHSNLGDNWNHRNPSKRKSLDKVRNNNKNTNRNKLL